MLVRPVLHLAGQQLSAAGNVVPAVVPPLGFNVQSTAAAAVPGCV